MTVTTELREHWLALVEDGWLARHEMAEINLKIARKVTQTHDEDPAEFQGEVNYLLAERAKQAGRLHSAEVARERLVRNDWKRFLLLCQLHGLWLAGEGGCGDAYDIREQLTEE
jgi:hypothetical protein